MPAAKEPPAAPIEKEVSPELPPPPTEEPYEASTPEQEVTEKPKTKPVVIQPPVSDKPKETPSIYNRKRKSDESSEEAPSVLDKKSDAFSEEALQQTWKAFSDNWKDAGDTDRLILNKEVKKGQEHEVVIYLGSQLEISFLEKFEVELVQYLRTELKNDHITLKRDIIQEEEAKKLYTSTDIFDYMVKQNPDLKDLKDRLGLDFDY